MANITYYVVLPFARNDEGDLVPAEPIEAQSSNSAKSRAALAASGGKFAGAVAFSRTGDPQLGDFNDAVVLGRYGETPDDLNL